MKRNIQRNFEIVDDTLTEIFDVSENRVFIPEVIVITNTFAGENSGVLSVDGDQIYPTINLDEDEMVALHAEDLLGLIVTDDGLDIDMAQDGAEIYVAGVEIGGGRNVQ